MTGITTPTSGQPLIPGLNMTASQLSQQRQSTAATREERKREVERQMAERAMQDPYAAENGGNPAFRPENMRYAPQASVMTNTGNLRKDNPEVFAFIQDLINNPDQFGQIKKSNINQKLFSPDSLKGNLSASKDPRAGAILKLQEAFQSGNPLEYITNPDNFGQFQDFLNFEDTGLGAQLDEFKAGGGKLSDIPQAEQLSMLKNLIGQKKTSGSMFQDNPLGTLALVAGLAFGGASLAGALGGGGSAAGAAASGIGKGAGAGLAKGAAGAAKAGGGFFKSLLPSFGKGSGILGKIGGAGDIAGLAGDITGNKALSKLGEAGSLIGGFGGGENFLKSGGNSITSGENVGFFDKVGGFFDKLGGGGNDIFSKIMGGLGVAGGLGAAGGGNALSDMLGFSNRDLESMLKGAEFGAPNVNLPGGVGGSFDPNTNTFSSQLGDLNPLRSLILGTAGQERPDAAIQGALRDFGLGSFGDTGDIEAQQLALLRERAAPGQQRRGNQAIQNLFSRGQFGQGSSQSGEVARGLAEAEAQEDLGFQLAARDLGLRTQGQRFGQGLDALGLGDQLRGSSLTRLLGASGGAQDLTKMGLDPLTMMLNFGIARSNASNRVGTNLIASQSGQNSLGDLLGLFAQTSGGTATVNV